MKYFLSTLILCVTLLTTQQVWAYDYGAPVTKIAQQLTIAPTKTAERQQTVLQNLITRANQMIDTRVNSLNELLSRVQNDTHLSTTDKSTLTTQIQTEITALQNLKAKIDADTDLATAQTDVKSIVGSYHIYVTFEPQLRLLTIISNLQATATNIQQLIPLLQNFSTTLKSEGKDTTKIDAAIADIQTQLSTVTTLLSSDKSTLDALVLTNNAYQSTFVSIRQDLAKVRADFAQVRHDIATIRESVGSLIGQSHLTIHATGIPTVNPTSAATPTP